MADIDCPRARTWMTPCVARDGKSAVADAGVCVGCGAAPDALMRDLATRYLPALAALPRATDAETAATLLAVHVAAYVEEATP